MHEEIESAEVQPEAQQVQIRRRSSTYELFILVLTIFSFVVVAALVFGPAKRNVDAVLWRVDSMICVIFFIDFLHSLWRAPNRIDYFFKKGGWLDLLGSIPAVPGRPWLALLRLARLNRLVRIVRRLRQKEPGQVMEEARQSKAQSGLLFIILAAIFLITAASLLIVPLERGAGGAVITRGADAFWWSVVTITTVGYGDYTPVTFPGRILAMALMTIGIGIFAAVTSFLASWVMPRADDEHEEIATLLKKENAMIRAELAELKALLLQLGSEPEDD